MLAVKYTLNHVYLIVNITFTNEYINQLSYVVVSTTILQDK